MASYVLLIPLTIALAEEVTPNKLSPTTTPGSLVFSRTMTAFAFVLKFCFSERLSSDSLKPKSGEPNKVFACVFIIPNELSAYATLGAVAPKTVLAINLFVHKLSANVSVKSPANILKLAGAVPSPPTYSNIVPSLSSLDTYPEPPSTRLKLTLLCKSDVSVTTAFAKAPVLEDIISTISPFLYSPPPVATVTLRIPHSTIGA